MSLSLEISVSSHQARVYHPGDVVSGKITLNTSQQEVFKSLKLKFHGCCMSSTTRPYMVGNESMHASRRSYSEVTPLFEQNTKIFKGPFTLAPNKHEWNFEFTFPSHTENTFSRSVNLNHFTKGPHALPPSFHSYTNVVGGEGSVHYGLEATLLRCKMRPDVKASQPLLFKPKARRHEATVRENVLNVITAKHTPDSDTSSASSKPTPSSSSSSFGRDLKGPAIRFIPTIHIPSSVTPAQTIPIHLSLKQLRRTDADPEIDAFTIDKLKIELTTSTRTLCGRRLNCAKDVLSRSVVCVDRSDTGIKVPLDDSPIPLTRAFALVDNEQASPSFRSFTVSRTYGITIKVTLSWEGHVFHVVKSCGLEILPRYVRRRRVAEEDEVDPLPLYTPREETPGYAEVMGGAVSSGTSSPALVERTDPNCSSESLASGSCEETSAGASEGESAEEDRSGTQTPMTVFSPSVANTPGYERPWEGAESYFPPAYETVVPQGT